MSEFLDTRQPPPYKYRAIAMNQQNTPVISAKDISVTLGGKLILDKCSIDVYAGEMKVLIGPSGAGKSTFLQCMNLLIIPDNGVISIQGEIVDQDSTKARYKLREHVGMIFQDFNLFDHLNAEDNVAIALRKVKGLSKKDSLERARHELARVGLEKRASLYPAELSGGQKQRVAIARALAMDPMAMLLDEPTSALDPELVGEVLSVIRDLAAGGMTMVMATHQMEFAQAIANQILFMENGRVIEQGTPSELLAHGSGTRTADFCQKLLIPKTAD